MQSRDTVVVFTLTPFEVSRQEYVVCYINFIPRTMVPYFIAMIILGRGGGHVFGPVPYTIDLGSSSL